MTAVFSHAETGPYSGNTPKNKTPFLFEIAKIIS